MACRILGWFIICVIFKGRTWLHTQWFRFRRIGSDITPKWPWAKGRVSLSPALNWIRREIPHGEIKQHERRHDCRPMWRGKSRWSFYHTALTSRVGDFLQHLESWVMFTVSLFWIRFCTSSSCVSVALPSRCYPIFSRIWTEHLF